MNALVRSVFTLPLILSPLAYGQLGMYDLRYAGKFEKLEVTLNYIRFCESNRTSGAGFVDQPQTGTTPTFTVDYSKLTCNWGSLSGIKANFSFPTVPPTISDLQSNRMGQFPVLDAPIVATSSISGTGTMTASQYPTNQVEARALTMCRDDDACLPYGKETRSFSAPGSASASANVNTSFKQIEKTDISGKRAFLAFFYQLVDFTVQSYSRDDSVKIELQISVKVTYRYEAMPVLGIPEANSTVPKTFNKPQSRTQTYVSIENFGEGTLNWTAEATTSDGGKWLFVDPATGSQGRYPPEWTKLSYGVEPSGVPAGTFSGKIKVTGQGTSNGPVEIPITFISDGVGDSVTLSSVTPDPTQPLQAGTEVTFGGWVQVKVASKPEGNVLLRVYDQSGALLNSGDSPVAVSGQSNQAMSTKVQLAASVTQVQLKAVLLDKSGGLLAESATFTYGAGVNDQVAMDASATSPDPSKPVPWADRLRIVAPVKVTLGTRDRADVVVRGTDQAGADLASCVSNTASLTSRGQYDVNLVIDDCWLKKDTRKVILKAVILPQGGGAAIKESVPVTLNLDVPPNSIKLGTLQYMSGAGQFISYQDRPTLIGGDQASPQLSFMRVRVDYDLIGDDGTIDLLMDADTAGRGTLRGTLVSGVRAPAGAKQQLYIALPQSVVVPREHNYWKLVARLNPKTDPPIETPRMSGASDYHFSILSIRAQPGFSPTEDTELGDPTQKQGFHFPLEVWTAQYRVAGNLKLKAHLTWSAYQTGQGGDTVDFGDPGMDMLYTADFSSQVPDDAGQVKLWFEIEGIPPDANGGNEPLRSRYFNYDCKRKVVTVGGSGPVSAPWASIDFQPLTVPNPRPVKPQVKPSTLGSIWDQAVAATGPGIKALKAPRMAVADPARDFLGINKVWSFDDVIPADGSFVNNVTFHYKAADLPVDPEFKEDKLQVVSWDPAAATLRWYTTTVDTGARTATARLDGLALYYSLAMPGPLSGGTLNLPLTGDRFQTAVSLINTGTADLPVSATAFTPGGRPFDAGVNPYTGTLPKGRAVTGTTDMIFKAGLGGDGWVQARSGTKSLAGGALLAAGGEMESVGASPPVASMLVFTNVELTDKSATELHLVNPGSFAAVAKLELRSAAGAVVDTAQLTLEPKGKRCLDLPGLFAGFTTPFTGYVLVKADHELAGVALITSGSALAALAAQPLSTTSKLFAAHVEAGRGALNTRVNLVNPGIRAVDGAIRFIGPDGTEPFAAATLRLDAGAQMQRDLSQLFDFQGQVVAGSLIVEAVPGVVGDIRYSDDAGKARCVQPLGPAATAQSFVQLATAQGSFTGFSVFNPGSAAASVLVKAYGLDGSLLGSARVQLGARGRHSDLLSKTIAGANGQLGGYFTVQSDQPVVAGAVIGSLNFAALAALDPQPAASDLSGAASTAQPVSNTLAGLPGLKPAAKPTIDASPSSLDFGSVSVGQTKDLSLTVRNTGGASLTVSSISASAPFSVISPPGSFTVNAGSSQTVTVRFAPTASGAQSATLRIASNDPDRPSVSVSLAGNGSGGAASGPSIQVSPDSLDFGTVTTGQSKDLSFTVRNAGGSALSVASISSSSPLFKVSVATFTLDPSASRDVKVTFAPTAAGSQFASITIASNDRANPVYIVSVNGKGDGATQPPPPGGTGVRIDITPSRLEFGDVTVGQTKDLTLTVSGTFTSTPLSVTSVTSDNPRFQIVNRTVPFGLGVGGMASIPVRFAPDAVGAQSGTITVVSNADNQPTIRIPVTGTGLPSGPQTVELVVDDGTMERPIGFPQGGIDGYYVNRLSPGRYPAKLTTIRIYFHDKQDALEQGTDIALMTSTCPTGQSHIDGLIWKRTMAKVKTPGQFNEYTVPEVTITEGDFVVGYTVQNPVNVNPTALDTSSPDQRRSFISTDGVSYKMTGAMPIQGGNLMIRAVVVVGAP